MGFVNTETKKHLQIWSYKYWTYEGLPIDHKEVIDFSVYFEDENDLHQIENML